MPNSSPLHDLIEALAECAANRPPVIFRLADPEQVAFMRPKFTMLGVRRPGRGGRQS